MSAAKGGVYSLVEKVIQIILSISSMAVLGRILTPDDFGIFALVLSVQIIVLPILNMGLQETYIKDVLDSNTAQSSYHFFYILIGIINTSILVIAAPILSFIYKKPELIPMVILFSGSVLLGSVYKQRLAHIVRQKRFGYLMVINSITQLGGFVSVIIFGFLGYGVWSLILKAWVIEILKTILVKIGLLVKYRWTNISQIKNDIGSLRFGVELTISRLLRGIMLSIDKMIFAKFFDVSSLGFYTKAIELARMPDSIIGNALSNLGFTYIVRQTTTQRLASYLLYFNIVSYLVIIPAGLCIVVGDTLVPVLMGHQWIESGVYLQILGVWGVGKAVQSISNFIYMVEGKSTDLIKVNFLAIPIVIGSAIIGSLTMGTPLGFVALLSISSIIYWFIILLFCFYSLENNSKYLLKYYQTIISVVIYLVVVYILKYFFINEIGNVTYHIELLVVLGLSLISFLPIHISLNRKQLLFMWEYVHRGLFKAG